MIAEHDFPLIVEGLPNRTRFYAEWIVHRDAYRYMLTTPDGFGVVFVTAEEVGYSELRGPLRSASPERSVAAMLQRKIHALRQRHYFGYVHARGGYC